MRAMLDKIISLLITASHEELVSRFRHVTPELKADGSLLTAADLAMQQRMQQVLADAWPEYDFLAEEMTRQQQQALLNGSGKGMWCLDPLDGTSNYAMGIPCFASSLAFIKERRVQLGVVYDPLREECFSAIRGQGAWLNGEPLSLRDKPHPDQPVIAIVDYKRLPATLAAALVTDPPYRSQRSFGSVALDWCWLAAGRSHVYLHGRQCIWDYAAGLLIFAEAGGYSSTLEGEPVFSLGLEPRSAVAALSKSLFARWSQRLRQY